MRCAYCGTEGTKTIDSRKARGGQTQRRRRECGECGERFTTIEVVEGMTGDAHVKRLRERCDNLEKKLKQIQRALSRLKSDVRSA